MESCSAAAIAGVASEQREGGERHGRITDAHTDASGRARDEQRLRRGSRGEDGRRRSRLERDAGRAAAEPPRARLGLDGPRRHRRVADVPVEHLGRARRGDAEAPPDLQLARLGADDLAREGARDARRSRAPRCSASGSRGTSVRRTWASAASSSAVERSVACASTSRSWSALSAASGSPVSRASSASCVRVTVFAPSAHCTPAGRRALDPRGVEVLAGEVRAVAQLRVARPEPDAGGRLLVRVALADAPDAPAPRPDGRDGELLGDLLRRQRLELDDVEPGAGRLRGRRDRCRSPASCGSRASARAATWGCRSR